MGEDLWDEGLSKKNRTFHCSTLPRSSAGSFRTSHKLLRACAVCKMEKGIEEAKINIKARKN